MSEKSVIGSTSLSFTDPNDPCDFSLSSGEPRSGEADANEFYFRLIGPATSVVCTLGHLSFIGTYTDEEETWDCQNQTYSYEDVTFRLYKVTSNSAGEGQIIASRENCDNVCMSYTLSEEDACSDYCDFSLSSTSPPEEAPSDTTAQYFKLTGNYSGVTVRVTDGQLLKVGEYDEETTEFNVDEEIFETSTETYALYKVTSAVEIELAAIIAEKSSSNCECDKEYATFSIEDPHDDCSEGYYWDGTQCCENEHEECDDGYTWSDECNKCLPDCESYQHRDGSCGECADNDCECGEEWDDDIGRCVSSDIDPSIAIEIDEKRTNASSLSVGDHAYLRILCKDSVLSRVEGLGTIYSSAPGGGSMGPSFSLSSAEITEELTVAGKSVSVSKISYRRAPSYSWKNFITGDRSPIWDDRSGSFEFSSNTYGVMSVSYSYTYYPQNLYCHPHIYTSRLLKRTVDGDSVIITVVGFNDFQQAASIDVTFYPPGEDEEECADLVLHTSWLKASPPTVDDTSYFHAFVLTSLSFFYYTVWFEDYSHSDFFSASLTEDQITGYKESTHLPAFKSWPVRKVAVDSASVPGTDARMSSRPTEYSELITVENGEGSTTFKGFTDASIEILLSLVGSHSGSIPSGGRFSVDADYGKIYYSGPDSERSAFLLRVTYTIRYIHIRVPKLRKKVPGSGDPHFLWDSATLYAVWTSNGKGCITSASMVSVTAEEGGGPA
jgi:hypothetical protein